MIRGYDVAKVPVFPTDTVFFVVKHVASEIDGNRLRVTFECVDNPEVAFQFLQEKIRNLGGRYALSQSKSVEVKQHGMEDGQ